MNCTVTVDPLELFLSHDINFINMKNEWKTKMNRAEKNKVIAVTFLVITLWMLGVLYNSAAAQTANTINTGTLYVSTGTLIGVEGSFTNSGAGSTTQEGDMYVKGDWINNGTFLSETGKVTFWGTSPQNLSGSTVTGFFNCNMNNASGISLSQNITIAGTLNLTAGLVTTGVNEVYVTNASTDAINPYSPTEYIVGYLRRNVSTTGSYYFPIGTAANYELANLNFTGMTGFTDILSSFTNAVPNPTALPAGLNVNGTPITDMLNYGYWTLTPNTSMTGGVYTVTVIEKGATNMGLSADRYCVIKRDNSGTAWQSLGTHNNSTQSVTATTVTAARSALSAFSDFGIGFTQQGFALPVELIFFNAQLKKDVVDLTWTTLSETNSDYFTIERSSDAVHFIEILKVDAAGNSNHRIDYKTIDEHPLQGVSYYRLKQTNFDGRVSDSLTDDVNYLLDDFSFTVLPNPTTIKNLNLNIRGAKDDKLTVTLTDASGKQVFSSTVTPDTDNYYFRINTNTKPAAGYYMAEIIKNGKVYSKSVVLQ